MIEAIVKQFRVKFAQLKGLVISNSITKEDAYQQASKLIFSANVVLASINKEPDEITLEKVQELQQFKTAVENFRKDYFEIYNDTEIQPDLVEELRVHLPETIHSDSLEETASL